MKAIWGILTLTLALCTASHADPSDEERLNILGVRTGAPASEVIALLRTKTPPLTEIYKSQLSYMDPTVAGQDWPVPNGEYITGAAINSRPDTSADGTVHVHFSPEPGRERVVLVARTVIFKDKILESEFISSLTKKYGSPLFDGENFGNALAWYSPVKAHGKKDMAQAAALLSGCGFTRADFRRSAEAWAQGTAMAWATAIQKPDSPRVRCGDIVLQVELSIDQAEKGRPYGQRLVNGFSATLVNWSLIATTSQSASAMVSAAQVAHRQREAEKAAGRKAPEL